MTENILVLEAALDDLSPELVGYVLERALALGALDAYALPAQMKKNRPGALLTILIRPEQRAELVALVLAETSTLGVRVSACEREVLPRRVVQVPTRYGVIGVKVAEIAGPGGARCHKAAPEFEDCRAAALRHAVPIRDVFAAALLGYSGEEPSKVAKS